MYLSKYLLLLLASLPTLLMAENLGCLKADKLEDWQGREYGKRILARNLSVTNDLLQTEKEAPLYIMSTELLCLEPGKKYRLGGKFRKIPGSKCQGRLYFALAPYDDSRRLIQGGNYRAVPGSDTQLLREAEPGARQLLVEDASAWLKRSGSMLAFNCLAEYEDLPNFDLSPPITHISQDNGQWIVTLRRELRHSYPVGNKVRQQVGAPYLYVASAVQLQDDWQELSGIFEPAQNMGPFDSPRAIPPGSKQLRIVVLSNDAINMQMKDVELCKEK